MRRLFEGGVYSSKYGTSTEDRSAADAADAISIWWNCSQSYLHSLNHIHERACRMINQLPSTIGDDLYLFRLEWPPIDYV